MIVPKVLAETHQTIEKYISLKIILDGKPKTFEEWRRLEASLPKELSEMLAKAMFEIVQKEYDRTWAKIREIERKLKVE